MTALPSPPQAKVNLSTEAPAVSTVSVSKRSRRSSGAVTLLDVARLAAVAPITASRAINQPSRVSADVLQRVQTAVAQTGYVPNRMAGALASSRSKLIAAIVPSTVMSVFTPTVESLNNTLFDAGYQLMLGQSDYRPEREAALLEAVIGRRPDGIFWAGLLTEGTARMRLAAAGIPVVESWDLSATPLDMLIGFSHHDVGQAVAAYFAAQGRRRLGLVLAGDARALRRAQAFSQAAQSLGLAPVHMLNVGDSRSLRSGRWAYQQLAQQAGHPEAALDAIFCSSDLLALGVVTEALACGVAVPQRLAVMGFGDVPFGADLSPALSTVHINGAQIGQLAAQYLIASAEGRRSELASPVDLGFKIISRGTG